MMSLMLTIGGNNGRDDLHECRSSVMHSLLATGSSLALDCRDYDANWHGDDDFGD